jgi:hypothetical protein
VNIYTDSGARWPVKNLSLIYTDWESILNGIKEIIVLLKNEQSSYLNHGELVTIKRGGLYFKKLTSVILFPSQIQVLGLRAHNLVFEVKTCIFCP